MRAGSLVIHRPKADHDGVYSPNTKVVCLSMRDKDFESYVHRLSPQLQGSLRQACSVFEPAADVRRKIVQRFASGANIIQSDSQVRNSSRAVAKFADEWVCDFLEVVEQQLPACSKEGEHRTAAMLRRIDVRKSLLDASSVADLCQACEVPRRTLNRAFLNALGMGPATYLRRIRLNDVRRALQQHTNSSTTVTDIALGLGFWHLGRFAGQYNELFGESPHETLRRAEKSL
ncbi:MAG: helix-turn-helix domain-containing protein [Bryobacteraceae bacterium]